MIINIFCNRNVQYYFHFHDKYFSNLRMDSSRSWKVSKYSCWFPFPNLYNRGVVGFLDFFFACGAMVDKCLGSLPMPRCGCLLSHGLRELLSTPYKLPKTKIARTTYTKITNSPNLDFWKQNMMFQLSSQLIKLSMFWHRCGYAHKRESWRE